MLFETVLFVGLLTLVSGSSSHINKNDVYNKASSLQSDPVRITQLENEFYEQRQLLLQLQSTVAVQDHLLQEAHGMIRQQDLELALLERELRQQKRQHQSYKSERAENSNTEFEQSFTPFTTSNEAFHVRWPSTKDQTSVAGSVSHHVEARSDDKNPLEAVVAQMGQKLAELSAQIQVLQNSYQQVMGAQGSTFIHWGSSQCGSASETVYSGFIGGSFYNQPGGGSNYLCLTSSPVASNHTFPKAVAYVYGGEYETADAYQDKDAICTVCRSNYPTTIMIPGTNVCAAGWHLDYSGFLMAGYYNQAAASDFICVDSKFESHVSGNRNNDGKLLYFTVTQCGSLPCEPYQNNKVVTCAVCSR